MQVELTDKIAEQLHKLPEFSYVEPYILAKWLRNKYFVPQYGRVMKAYTLYDMEFTLEEKALATVMSIIFAYRYRYTNSYLHEVDGDHECVYFTTIPLTRDQAELLEYADAPFPINDRKLFEISSTYLYNCCFLMDVAKKFERKGELVQHISEGVDEYTTTPVIPINEDIYRELYNLYLQLWDIELYEEMELASLGYEISSSSSYSDFEFQMPSSENSDGWK